MPDDPVMDTIMLEYTLSLVRKRKDRLNELKELMFNAHENYILNHDDLNKINNELEIIKQVIQALT